MTDETSQTTTNPQLDLLSPNPDRDAGLGAELWTRRHDRLDRVRGLSFSREDARLVPLVLALARLAAQRDAGLSLTTDLERAA